MKGFKAQTRKEINPIPILRVTFTGIEMKEVKHG
tara:strand:- start:604 stop:705 length:102 start_codon:yes stop_codon:yes gene_type:complete